MPADHYSTAQRFLTMAANEHASLRNAKQRVDVELHGMRRQLERAHERIGRLEAEVARLEVEVETQKAGVASARRATLEHVGRSS